jgi:thiamine biosynthesis lipoprotein
MMSSTFHAMGTDVRVVTPLDHDHDRAHHDALRAITATFAEAERCFSRFAGDSELSRLNRSTGPAVVSPLLFDALSRAAQHVEATRGLFDPAIGGDLLAAGYVRGFAPQALDRPEPAGPTRAHGTFAALTIDAATRTVLRPPGVLLDLGGFVKGWTADRAARLLPATSVIDAGGDAVLRGRGEDGEGWLLDVEDPFDQDHVVCTLRVSDCAVATSGVNRRRWLAGGQEQHHLIDPRTSRPASSDVAQVTVLASSAEEAEVLAKTALLLGSREGQRFLRARPGIRGVIVRRDRTLVTVGEVAS